MPRVKNGTVTRRRRKAVLKEAKGNVGGRRRLFKNAKETVMRGWAYAYRDRKVRKREFRRLWIARINAACRANGITYSIFMDGLKKAEIEVDRKMLAELAVSDSEGFRRFIDAAMEARA